MAPRCDRPSLRFFIVSSVVLLYPCSFNAAERPALLADLSGAAEWLPQLTTIERACVQDVYPQQREDLSHMLNCLGLNGTAVEVGVQTGVHAETFLRFWTGERLLLVDKWQGISDAPYIDIANLQSGEMDSHRRQCEERMRPFGERAEVRAMWSVDAAATVPDASLDFVYLDARHDFCGVLADIVAWWPKLRRGGVFAGHDFCDGELPEGDFFVRSALTEFFGEPLPLLQTQEWDRYRSFFVVKTPLLESRASAGANTEAAPPLDANARYYSLYKEAESESQGDAALLSAAFTKRCLSACSNDCHHRVEVVTGKVEDFSAEICVGPRALGVRAALPDINEQLYLSVCVDRCRVTCEQRLQLFATLGGGAVHARRPCHEHATPQICTADAAHSQRCTA